METDGERVTLALHDLTGFNGRCDAVYITDGDDVPREDYDFRREITVHGSVPVLRLTTT